MKWRFPQVFCSRFVGYFSCSKLLKSKFSTYLFKLLFILMRLSNSSLWEKKEYLPSVKVRDRFSIKQLFLSFLKFNKHPTFIIHEKHVYLPKLSSDRPFCNNLSQSFKWIEIPAFLEALQCLGFLYLLYGTYLAVLCNVLDWPKSLLNFKQK